MENSRKRITLLDGAVGTSLWARAEQRGLDKIPVWRFNLEQPEMVTEQCRDYLNAGAEIILANTFGANRPSVERSSKYDPAEVVKTAVRLTRQVTDGTSARTALAIGPLSMLMEPYGDLTEEEAAEIFEEMIGNGMDAGAELIMIQTFIDLEMMKVAAKVARQYKVPVFCTMSFEKVGKTIMGNSVQQMIEELTPIGIDAIGLNCSTGPADALHIVETFAANTDLPIVFKPNAGKPVTGPDGKTVSPYTPEMFIAEVQPALQSVSYIGGCCGCDASYTRALKTIL